MRPNRLLRLTCVALILTASATAAEDRYSIADAQLQWFDPCDPAPAWSVVRAAPLCDREICVGPADGDIGALPGVGVTSERLTGQACGSEASHCVVLLLDWGLWREGSIHYAAPFPSVFEPQVWEAFISAPRRARLVNERSRLVPVDLAARSYDITAIEAEVASRADRVFIDLSLDDGSIARALCEVNQGGESPVVPRNCIITQLQRENEVFVLALVAPTPERWSCLRSERFRIAHRFEVVGEDGMALFADNIVQALHSEGPRLDLDTLDLVLTDERLVLLGAAGPRLSTIDPRLREKLDLVLTGSISPVARIIEGERLQGQGIVFSGTVAAWVGRQNVDPAREWFWPDDQYYQQMVDEVVSALLNAFERSCEEIGHVYEVQSSIHGVSGQCRPP